MNLKDAIKHANNQYEKLGDCKCGLEHKHLADWLKELAIYEAIGEPEELVKVVRCKDCHYSNTSNVGDRIVYCKNCDRVKLENGFCNLGVSGED